MITTVAPPTFACVFGRLLRFTLPCALLGAALLLLPPLFALGGGLLFFAGVSATVYGGRRLSGLGQMGLAVSHALLVTSLVLALLASDPTLFEPHAGGPTVVGTLAFFAGWLAAYHSLRVLAARLGLPAVRDRL